MCIRDRFPVELIFLFITGTILLSFHKRSPVFSVPGGPLQLPFMKKYQFFLTVIVFCRRLESPVPLCQPGSFLRRIAENTYPAVSFFIKQADHIVCRPAMIDSHGGCRNAAQFTVNCNNRIILNHSPQQLFIIGASHRRENDKPLRPRTLYKFNLPRLQAL